MPARNILYFDRPGPENTDAVVQAVKTCCAELGIRHVVVASGSGASALKLWEALQGMGVTLVSIPGHAGFSGGDASTLGDEKRKEQEDKGIKVLICGHALSGVGRSITQKFGGVSHVEIIAHTLRQFGGDGLKVAVEVAVMAADAGLVPTDREIITVGGTRRGLDTAVVLKAAHMNNFFDLEIREIIAKPRQRSTK
jgi:hypothetical protein